MFGEVSYHKLDQSLVLVIAALQLCKLACHISSQFNNKVSELVDIGLENGDFREEVLLKDAL